MQQQLMQQQQQLARGALNTTSITTDHIQQYLDENKSLILRILENQNSGKLGECAENQAKLQRNLMYLAAIADSQPPPSPVYAQAGMNYMQQHQSQQMVSDPVIAARPSIFCGQQQQQQHQYMSLQQQQALQSQLGAGTSTGHSLQSDITLASGATGMFPNFSRNEGWQAASRAGGSSKKEDNESTSSVGDHSGKSCRE